jgi:superoxide dismutase, Cu-Zn family
MIVLRSALLLSALVAIGLSACNTSETATFTGSAKQYVFTPQGGSTANGSAKKILLSDGTTATTLTVNGLVPLTQYVAHYHTKGSASSNACLSNGGITEGFGSFTTNASGNATVQLLSDTNKLSGSAGAYINVHLATSLTTVPLCADLEGAGTAVDGITGMTKQDSFTAQGGSTASGTTKIVALSDGTTATTLVLAGLKANTEYAAHYHVLGAASSKACQSNGIISLGFANFTTDASGNATVRMLGLSALISGTLGAYINVHSAADLTNVPLCDDLTD